MVRGLFLVLDDAFFVYRKHGELHPSRCGELVGGSPRKPVLSEWLTKAFVAFVDGGALSPNRVALEANLYIVRRR